MGVPYKGPKLKDLVARIRHEVKFTRFVRDCPVCGASPTSVEPMTDRYGFETALGHCGDCHHRWLTETMTAEGAARFYDAYYRKLLCAYHKKPMGPRFFMRKQKLHTEALWEYLKRFLPDKKRLWILDVGGAYGGVSQFIKERLAEDGVRVTVAVLDRGKDELQHARKLGHRVIEELIDEKDWHPGIPPYGLVLVRKTLHHVADLKTAVGNLRILCKGRLFVDAIDWEAKLAEYGSEAKAVEIEHKQYFSEKSYNLLFGERFTPVNLGWRVGVHFGGVWE